MPLWRSREHSDTGSRRKARTRRSSSERWELRGKRGADRTGARTCWAVACVGCAAFLEGPAGVVALGARHRRSPTQRLPPPVLLVQASRALLYTAANVQNEGLS